MDNRQLSEILDLLQEVQCLALSMANAQARTHKIVKEMLRTMATKEDLNTALEGIATEVAKLGADLSAHLSALESQIAAGADVSDSLTKANEIAAKLQSIDETIPERVQPDNA